MLAAAEVFAEVLWAVSVALAPVETVDTVEESLLVQVHPVA